MESGRTKTILLVEDQSIIAMATTRTLGSFGYTSITADSGENAVRIAAERADVDLVLMDIDLGRGMDGTEAARLILEKRDLPVVFLSSHTELEIVAKTEDVTSYGYIVKNSGPTILHAGIKMAFRLFAARVELKDREEHFRSLFEDAIGPVFIEDYSAAKRRIDQARASGVTDFRAWLRANPSEMEAFKDLIQVVDLNREAFRALGRPVGMGKPKTLRECLGPEAVYFFEDELVAIAEGATSFEAEIPIRTGGGETSYFFLQLNAVKGHEADLSRVHVMLIDISETKRVKGKLRQKSPEVRRV